MAFIARPVGNTLRRFDEALVKPHDPRERFDGNFPVAMRCELCGEVGMAGRAEVREAMAEHRRSHCKARHTHENDPTVMRIAYPQT